MEKKICSKCGAENPGGNLLCKNCGEELYRPRVEREEEEQETIRRIKSNPAIPWMSIGCILVIVGLGLSIVIQPPSGEYTTTTAKEWETYADFLKYCSIINIIGLLLFMVATIYGMSWNADAIRMIYSKIKKT